MVTVSIITGLERLMFKKILTMTVILGLAVSSPALARPGGFGGGFHGGGFGYHSYGGYRGGYVPRGPRGWGHGAMIGGVLGGMALGAAIPYYYHHSHPRPYYPPTGYYNQCSPSYYDAAGNYVYGSCQQPPPPPPPMPYPYP